MKIDKYLALFLCKCLLLFTPLCGIIILWINAQISADFRRIAALCHNLTVLIIMEEIMRRILSIVTVLILCLTLFAACGKDKGNEGEIYIPIRKGNKVNYNTEHAYKGTILEQSVLDAVFTTPYSTDLCFTMMGGTISEINVREDADVKAGDVIARLDSEELENEIRVQELKYNSAKSTYEVLSKRGGDEAELAKIDMEIEESVLNDLIARRDFLVITAPYDGRISYLSRYRVGSQIAKNAIFCTITDTSRVCLSATDDGSLVNIGFGAKVSVSQGALVNTTGTVVDVVSEEFTGSFGGWGNFGEGAGNRTYSVNRFVIKPDEEVEFEDFGNIQVTFTTLRRDDAVIVPSNTVFEFGDGHAVYVLINGVKVQTSVGVGIVSGDKTEITSGLDGSETLVVP